MLFFIFFNDTATTEIYTLSLHDALPISAEEVARAARPEAHEEHENHREASGVAGQKRVTKHQPDAHCRVQEASRGISPARSEEHTSELQSRQYIVCRLLLEKKKTSQANQ